MFEAEEAYDEITERRTARVDTGDSCEGDAWRGVRSEKAAEGQDGGGAEMKKRGEEEESKKGFVGFHGGREDGKVR